MFKLTRSYNWLIFKLINPELEKRLKQYASGKLLDIGCGEKPYAQMAAPFIDEHIGVDYEDTAHDQTNIDLYGTAYEIPVENNAYDTILCTDVLEHLAEPMRAVKEAFRVLKPGGYAIYTVPLFWHLHEEPHDYYRFTKYGLDYMFKENGFDVIEIKALSGFFATFGQEFAYFLNSLRRGGRRNPLWWIIPPIALMVQGVAFLLNKIEHSKRFTMEYIAVLKKPGNSSE